MLFYLPTYPFCHSGEGIPEFGVHTLEGLWVLCDISPLFYIWYFPNEHRQKVFKRWKSMCIMSNHWFMPNWIFFKAWRQFKHSATSSEKNIIKFCCGISYSISFLLFGYLIIFFPVLIWIRLIPFLLKKFPAPFFFIRF